MNKRDFFRAVGGTSLGLTLGNTKALFARHADRPPADLAKDEAFWAEVRARFRRKPDYVNLENITFATSSSTPRRMRAAPAPSPTWAWAR